MSIILRWTSYPKRHTEPSKYIRTTSTGSAGVWWQYIQLCDAAKVFCYFVDDWWELNLCVHYGFPPLSNFPHHSLNMDQKVFLQYLMQAYRCFNLFHLHYFQFLHQCIYFSVSNQQECTGCFLEIPPQFRKVLCETLLCR